MTRQLVSLLLLLGATGIASAADSAALYRSATTETLAKCRLSVSIAQGRMRQGDSAQEALNNGNGSDGDGNWPVCISGGKVRSLELLRSALQASKKASARDALKSYHAIFSSALDGVTPASNEPISSYSQRQRIADSRLTEAWTKFELDGL